MHIKSYITKIYVQTTWYAVTINKVPTDFISLYLLKSIDSISN